jgi:hypothetical protein
MAEGVGFEPTDPCGSPVFKTGAINRSTIPPEESAVDDLSAVNGHRAVRPNRGTIEKLQEKSKFVQSSSFSPSEPCPGPSSQVERQRPAKLAHIRDRWNQREIKSQVCSQKKYLIFRRTSKS